MQDNTGWWLRTWVGLTLILVNVQIILMKVNPTQVRVRDHKCHPVYKLAKILKWHSKNIDAKKPCSNSKPRFSVFTHIVQDI